jgi:hypothetical protein
LYGLLFAFMAPYFMIGFAVPIVLLLAIAIWALPASDLALDKWQERLFFLFLCILIIWPNYLAVAIPGLPWITLVRLVVTPLVIVFLASLSTTASVGATISTAVARSRTVVALLIGFVVVQTLTLVFSGSVFASIDQYVTAQTTWTAIFFISVFVFSQPGRIEVWASILWAATIVVALLGLIEYRLGHVVWAGHIPSFLKIEDEFVVRTMKGQMRAYTGVQRVQSTFSTSVGLGEYIALSLPFILYFALENFPRIVRSLALATAPLLFFVANVSGARSGMIGYFLTFLAYLFAWGAIRWRRVRGGLIGPAIVWGYPVIFAMFLTATFFIGRLHRMVWGGSETDPSTNARRTQWQMGWPKILHHPWGYGEGRSGVVLGFHDPSGLLTVDTYYLTVLLEYGVAGFILYFGAFLFAIGNSAKYVLIPFDRRDREAGFLLPACICLMNFVVIKSVFSQQDSHPLVFMVLGMTVALIHRIRSETPSGAKRLAWTISDDLSSRAKSEGAVVA